MSKKIEQSVYTRHTVCARLTDYCTLAKEHDMVEVCEWHNGEGWDISVNDKQVSLTHGELAAINALVGVL
jgi:hypothetical protein